MTDGGGNFYRIKTSKGYRIVRAPEPVSPIALDQPNDVSLGGKQVLSCDLCDKRFVSDKVAEAHYLRDHSERKRQSEDWKAYFTPVEIYGSDAN